MGVDKDRYGGFQQQSAFKMPLNTAHEQPPYGLLAATFGQTTGLVASILPQYMVRSWAKPLA